MNYPAAIKKGMRHVKEGSHTFCFQNVWFAYPGAEVSVLKGVNLSISPGEHLSVVGLNGAGKTTFIKLLCRLYDPTAALDPIAEYEIYRQFEELVAGKTAIYISHRLSSCQFCDRIAVYSDGVVKEYGTHGELAGRENGIYAGMFAAQAQYYV